MHTIMEFRKYDLIDDVNVADVFLGCLIRRFKRLWKGNLLEISNAAKKLCGYGCLNKKWQIMGTLQNIQFMR